MTGPADPRGTAARFPLDRLVERVVGRLRRRAATAPAPVSSGGSNRARLALFGTVISLAAAAVLSGLLFAAPLVHAPPAALGRLAIATAVATLALVARVRVRVGATYISLGWGEAAVIVALYLVKPGWIPLVMLVGATVANGVWWAAGQVTSVLQVLYNAASLTMAGSAAAGCTLLIGRVHRAPFTIPTAGALVAAAVVYALIGVGLTAASARARTGDRLVEVAARTLSSKVFMIVGNITVGLTVVVIIEVDLRWLIILPPVLLLLRQSYGYRLRVDDERRGWRLFAISTRALNRLDEQGVAEAAISGVTRLFAAETVEVRVLRGDGSAWCYRSGKGTDLHVGPAPEREPAGEAVIARPLLVRGACIGELRLSVPRAVQLTAREQNQLSAFGDALAAALHDAASHQELQALSARSSHDALHDTVTGLPNREALLARGNAALRVLDPESPVALVLLDIDHFREVNDTLGHSAGDELLRITAHRLSTHARTGELVARLGGDEFALLITAPPAGTEDESDALDHALGRAREVVDVLTAPTSVAGVPIAVEVSIGVVAALAGDSDMTELLRRADIAMYQAKRGPGSVSWYDSAGDVGSTDRLALLAELREALAAADQLVLALQPVVDLHTGAPAGVEALIRWQHPRRGELTPAEFIDVLENSELIAPFTRYVIDRALATVAQLRAAGVTVPISVNLSPRSLLDRRLPDQVGQLLDRHQVPAGQLILEITETVVVPESPTVNQVLELLRHRGVQLAVDDFGTGYSSLTFLTRVHVDEVKVDQTFVARMVESPEAMAIVRTIVDLARQLGLRVVAEGVETAEQRAALARLGCDAAQGYHFFHPMGVEKAAAVLRQLADSAQARVIPLRAEGAS